MPSETDMADDRDERCSHQDARRTRTAEALRLYLHQVGRKAPKGGGDPNDRRYSRDVANAAKRMKPEALDALLRDGDEE